MLKTHLVNEQKQVLNIFASIGFSETGDIVEAAGAIA